MLQELKDNKINYVDTGYNEDLVGKRYLFYSHNEHEGVMTKMVNSYYQLRKKYKKISKTSKDPEERLIFDKKQYAIKIILNSCYGVMGTRWFRLYKVECADAITFFGRKALSVGVERFKDHAVILGGDTDSTANTSLIRYRFKQ